MNVTYQVERLKTVAGEVAPLLEMHFAEVGSDRESMPLKVDWPRYYAMEEAGVLVVCTARSDGKLVGYSAFFLYEHPHHEGKLVAHNDVLFLHPDYRRGLAGRLLMQFSEFHLKQRGVHKVMWHVTYANDFSRVLYRMGYRDEEKIVSKVL